VRQNAEKGDFVAVKGAHIASKDVLLRILVANDAFWRISKKSVFYKGKRGYSALKFLLLFISIVFYVEIKIQVTEIPTIFRWFKLPRRKIRSTGYF
jgi:hypothetical protein